MKTYKIDLLPPDSFTRILLTLYLILYLYRQGGSNIHLTERRAYLPPLWRYFYPGLVRKLYYWLLIMIEALLRLAISDYFSGFGINIA